MNTYDQLANDICDPGFHIIDNFLDPAHYQALRAMIQTTQQKGQFRQGKIGQKLDKTHDATIRTDHIFWLDKEEGNHPLNAFFFSIDSLCDALNQSLFLGLVDYEAHFALYEPNSYYKKHVDQFSSTKNRRISCVYYLNADWQAEFGGELKLYDKADKLLTSILPLGNRLACFESTIPHEVCTTHQMRYSITAWLKTRPLSPVIF